MEVRFHRLAAREYQEVRNWYERRRPGLGVEFATEMGRAASRIAEYPHR